MVDATLIYGLATLGTGVLGLSIRYCFKSKCSSIIFCWGLCNIVRNTEDEVKAEELELQHPKQNEEIDDRSIV